MTTAAHELDDVALDSYVKDPRFSRLFELPAATDQKPLRISYADYGYRNEEQPELENVFLFFAPLLGSRMTRVALDAVAKKHRVRIINPDRPGFGQTPNVSVDKRLEAWRDAIPALLDSLGVRHVSLGAQSGGTVYAVDMLLHHPEILHPERPYLAIGAPWIHPDHSDSLAMTITNSLPAGLVGQTDKLAYTLGVVSGPMLQSSMGAYETVTGWFRKSEEPDGPEARFEKALMPKAIELAYSESVKGLSDDALLLMKKKTEPGWGDWSDYDVGVPRLRELLRTQGKRLDVDVFFAKSDYMVGDAGTAGPTWFENCWKDDAADGPIKYSSTVVPESDHDSTWMLSGGVPERVMAKIGGSEPGV